MTMLEAVRDELRRQPIKRPSPDLPESKRLASFPKVD